MSGTKRKGYSYVSYVAGYKQCGDMRLSDYKRKSFTTRSVTRYGNCTHRLFKLSKCAEMFLLFITEKMDKNTNCITHTKALRTAYISWMQKSCGKRYQDDTVKKAFKEIVTSGLIISYGVRLDYTVNPLHFFRGSEKSRKELIGKLMGEIKNCNSKSNIKLAMSV